MLNATFMVHSEVQPLIADFTGCSTLTCLETYFKSVDFLCSAYIMLEVGRRAYSAVPPWLWNGIITSI